MPYAIELYFEKESAKKVQEMKTKLKAKGIDIDEGTRPHISLSIYEDLNIGDFKGKLQRFAKTRKCFGINLGSIGIFATEFPVVYLAPTVTIDLLKLHQDFHTYFGEYDSSTWDYYRPGIWVPHCTLAMNLKDEKVKEAVEISREFSLPINVVLDKIGVLEFSPNKHLFEFELGKQI